MITHSRTPEQQKLEEEIMRMLLSGDDPVLKALREQYNVAKTTSFEHSGVGFFTDLMVPKERILKEGRMDFELDDVYAKLKGLELEVGFVLFIRDGRLEMLEGFTHGDDDWPFSPVLVEAYYVHQEPPSGPISKKCPERDLEQIRVR